MRTKLQEAFCSEGATLTAASRRAASRLLDQQLWCFGRDIAKPRQNRLLGQGFVRYKAPEETRCYSNYQLEGDDFRVSLWGFGIWFGTKSLGSVLLRRYRFAPVWSEEWAFPRQVWRQHELTGLRCPHAPKEFSQAGQLLERLCLWLAEYESQVIQDLGRDYRREVVSEWGQLRKPTIDADWIAPHWQAIANSDWDSLVTTHQEAA